MDHCAIDVGGRKSRICIRDSSGTIQFEGALETAGLGDHLRQLPHCRVILETAAESFRNAGADVGSCRTPAARKLQLWAAEVEKRRGKAVAIVALARKPAGILFALWRDGTEFKSC